MTVGSKVLTTRAVYLPKGFQATPLASLTTHCLQKKSPLFMLF
jgi:hypothetical protein